MENSEQPAYPISEESTDRIIDGVKIYTGLTKREYFAAMRKDPIFGEDSLSLNWAKIIMGNEPPKDTLDNIKWWIAATEKFAVMRADALLTELSKSE